MKEASLPIIVVVAVMDITFPSGATTPAVHASARCVPTAVGFAPRLAAVWAGFRVRDLYWLPPLGKKYTSPVAESDGLLEVGEVPSGSKSEYPGFNRQT
jgi:hypothetical protein